MICSSRASCEHGESHSHTPMFLEDSALKCYYKSKVSALRGFLVLYRQMESNEVAGPRDSAAPCMSLNVEEWQLIKHICYMTRFQSYDSFNSSVLNDDLEDWQWQR